MWKIPLEALDNDLLDIHLEKETRDAGINQSTLGLTRLAQE